VVWRINVRFAVRPLLTAEMTGNTTNLCKQTHLQQACMDAFKDYSLLRM
jgi:hypothetical protein